MKNLIVILLISCGNVHAMQQPIAIEDGTTEWRAMSPRQLNFSTPEMIDKRARQIALRECREAGFVTLCAVLIIAITMGSLYGLGYLDGM